MSDRIGFLSTTAIGLALYLPLLSRWYDLNGLYEASAVDTGVGLLWPNHMLYRPIGFLVYQAARFVGYEGLSVDLLQVVGAVFGAVGLGLAYVLFRRLSGHAFVALSLSTGMGVSLSYWAYSTDISYIVPAVLPVAAALVCVVQRPVTWPRAVGIGLLCALAVLLWQANVLLVPLLAIVLLAQRERPVLVVAFLAASVGVVALVYVLAAVVVYSQPTLVDALLWAVRYGGAPLPQWGQLQADRVPLAAIHQLASLGPLASGMRLDQFGTVVRGSLQTQVAVLTMGLLALWALGLLVRARPHRGMALWLGAGYLLYIGFIAWWDPYEPKWFVVPNLFLGALLALLWGRGRRVDMAVLAGCVAILAICNLTAVVWPRHVQPNPSLVTAQCVGEHMGAQDVVLVGDWQWNGYLDYFYSRHSVLLVGQTAALGSKEAVLAMMARLTREQSNGGASVYMSDWDAYPADHMSWFTAQTGLTRDDLRRFRTEPAFTCNGVSLVRIVGESEL